MGSQFRTALAGAGVMAICVALSMMKGHHLLMAFAAAGMACGLWSWVNHNRKNAVPQITEAKKYLRRARRTAEESNVYSFPSQQQWSVSDVSGS